MSKIMTEAKDLIRRMSYKTLKEFHVSVEDEMKHVVEEWKRSCQRKITRILPSKAGRGTPFVVVCRVYGVTQSHWKFVETKRQVSLTQDPGVIMSDKKKGFGVYVPFFNVTSIRRGGKVLYRRKPLEKFKVKG